MASDDLLVLKRITREYREFRLGPLGLSVPHGYVMGLVGANGAGRTTAIRITLGAVSPENGLVHPIDKTRISVVLDQPC